MSQLGLEDENVENIVFLYHDWIILVFDSGEIDGLDPVAKEQVTDLIDRLQSACRNCFHRLNVNGGRGVREILEQMEQLALDIMEILRPNDVIHGTPQM